MIYKRYASLFFITCVDRTDNELVTLEMIHLFVEILDRYFGNVCELDIIFNFHKAYYILDEVRRFTMPYVSGYALLHADAILRSPSVSVVELNIPFDVLCVSVVHWRPFAGEQ